MSAHKLMHLTVARDVVLIERILCTGHSIIHR